MSKAHQLRSPKNQVLWEKFVLRHTDLVVTKRESQGKEKSKKAVDGVIAQYKEGMIALDSLVSDFAKITPDVLAKVREMKPKKVNHINGLLIAVHVNAWAKLRQDTRLALLPSKYQGLF